MQPFISKLPIDIGPATQFTTPTLSINRHHHVGQDPICDPSPSASTRLQNSSQFFQSAAQSYFSHTPTTLAATFLHYHHQSGLHVAAQFLSCIQHTKIQLQHLTPLLNPSLVSSNQPLSKEGLLLGFRRSRDLTHSRELFFPHPNTLASCIPS